MKNKDSFKQEEKQSLPSALSHERGWQDELDHDQEVLQLVEEGESNLFNNRTDDQDRRPRRSRLLKETQKYREVGKGDSRYVKLSDKKHVESGRVKGIHKPQHRVKKDWSYRLAEKTREASRDSSEQTDILGQDFGLDRRMKKSYRRSEMRKHLSEKALTDEVIQVRVVGSLENESGRAVAWGPLRGVLPVQQICLPSVQNKQDFMDKRVGSIRSVKVMKPAGYDEPFIVSHREVSPSLQISSVLKAYKNTKEFKDASRLFTTESQKKFISVRRASPKLEKDKKTSGEEFENHIDWIVQEKNGQRQTHPYKKDFAQAQSLRQDQRRDRPEQKASLSHSQKKVRENYLDLYVFTSSKKKKEMEEVGVRAYEYMESL